MVEHAAVNRRVVGSSPTRGAKKEVRKQLCFLFFFLPEEYAAVIPTRRDAGSGATGEAEVRKHFCFLFFPPKRRYGAMARENTETCALYILESVSAERYYVGVSSDPSRRLAFHNSREKGFTARYRPWKIVFMKRYPCRSEALAVERRIKSWKSRSMIARVVSGGIRI